MKLDGSTTIHYVEQGRGDPVVFVHGSFSDHRVWDGQRPAVALRFRFIAMDQRYFGAAPWQDNAAQFSVATHANDLATFIERLQSGPVHLVGWSYGGTVLLILAAQRPELVRSLFLYEPALGTIIEDPADRSRIAEDRKGLAPAVAASKSNDQAKAVQLFSDWVLNQPNGYDGLSSRTRTIYQENSKTLPPFLASPPPPHVTCNQLAQFKKPVTVARGEHTRTTFSLLADATHRCLPGSRLVVVPNARHMGPITDTSAVNNALARHLQRQ